MKRVDAIGRRRRKNAKAFLGKIYSLRYLFCLASLGFGYIFLSNKFFSNRNEFVNNKFQTLDSLEKRRNEVYKNAQAALSEITKKEEQSINDISNTEYLAVNYEGNGDSQDSEDDSSRYNFKLIRHSIEYSNTKRFFVLESFLIDGDKNRPSFSSNIDDFLIVALGVGEFTAQPNHRAKAEDGRTPREIPNLLMKIELTEIDEILELSCIVHTNGTYFQNKFNRHGDRKFEGEKGVWISAVLPKEIGETLQDNYNYQDIVGKIEITSDHPGEKSLVFRHHPFIVSNINVLNYIASEYNSYELVHCTAPVHSVTGYRFLIEYILYHKIVGFDHLHLYLYDKNYLEQVTEVLNQFSSFLTVHDWSVIPMHGIHSVKISNYEHAQRLARNDCFFRNRGLSRYISFSDIDEVFSVNSFEGEFESVVAIKELIKNLENKVTVNEFVLKRSNRGVHGVKRIIDYLDLKYQEDNSNIAFEFTSVTTPPFDILDQKFTERELAAAPRVAINNGVDSFTPYLNRFSVSEVECMSPYNCGEFHRGRQKYMLRTARGTINPNNPLFYHAVSEEYEQIASKLSVQVPTSIGFLRHYAGHFKSSRFGGLPKNNRKIMSLPYYVLQTMKNSVEGNQVLLKYYFDSENNKETLLGLSRLHDLERFMKQSDDVEVQITPLEEPEIKYLTFDRFTGRLNNQLITFDWAFRFSKAFNRRLFISDPTSHRHPEFYIGFPTTPKEEKLQAGIWNTSLLRSNFDFWFYFDEEYLNSEDKALIDLEPEQLPEPCVWDYERDSKILPLFLEEADKNKACKRIHLSTRKGLIPPKRSDTRKYGVGPLYFWSAFKPTTYLLDLVNEFIAKVHNVDSNKILVGFHSRSHREQKDRLGGICLRLATRVVEAATNYLNSFQDCCQNPSPQFNSALPESVDTSFLLLGIEKYTDQLDYFKMCDIPESYMEMFNLNDKEMFDIVYATDHRNERVDEMFARYGIRQFDLLDEIKSRRPVGAVDHINRDVRENVILDMLTAANTDYFHGSGSSTLSQVICFWRLVEARKAGYIEQSNFCHFSLLSTGSYTCDSMQCSAVDAHVSALYELVVGA